MLHKVGANHLERFLCGLLLSFFNNHNAGSVFVWCEFTHDRPVHIWKWTMQSARSKARLRQARVESILIVNDHFWRVLTTWWLCY